MIKNGSLPNVFTVDFKKIGEYFFRVLAFSEKTLNIVSQF